MNPGHVKGVHDVNEVAIFWLMNFAFREYNFLSKNSHKKSNKLLVLMYSSFVHILILSLITLYNGISSTVDSEIFA